MIQYWTFWNYLWWISYKNKCSDLSPSLRCSIISTSIVGGFMVYIYPRKMIARFANKKLKIPYIILVLGDIVFHQYPLYDIIQNNHLYSNKICGSRVLIPFGLWYTGIHYSKIRKEKIYGIKLNYLVGACAAISALYGLNYHTNKTIKSLFNK